jgi:hypothetical protein
MTYLGVTEVAKRGIRVERGSKQPTVASGEELIAVLNNGLWSTAPIVTDPSEYRHFYDQYHQGFWLGMDLYRLPKSEVPNCPDEGRVDVETYKAILKEKAKPTQTA